MPARIDAASWPVAYPAQVYAVAQRQKRDRRWQQREADRARGKARPSRTPASDRVFLAELAQVRAADRRAAIARRQVRGLVSDGHAILQHFVATVPGAARLLTGDHPGEARLSKSKLLALEAAYFYGDPRMLGLVCIPLAGTFPGGFDGLKAAILGLGAPEPCFAVGEEDAAGLHEPHAFWPIAEPVSATGKARKPPIWLWDLTCRALAEKLRPIVANPAGIGPDLAMKNPLSPRWSHRVMAERPYTLQEDKRPGAPGFVALEPLLDLASVRDRLHAARKAAWERADRPPPLAPEDRRAALSAGGKKGGQKGGKVGPANRGAATLAAVVEAIRHLVAVGRRPTQAAVAAEIGRCLGTVKNHWTAAKVAVAEGANKASAIDRGKATPSPPALAVPAIHKSIGGRRRPTTLQGRRRATETPCGLVDGKPGPLRSRFPHPTPAAAARSCPTPPFLTGRRRRPGGGACAEGGREPPCAETWRRPPSAGPPGDAT